MFGDEPGDWKKVPEGNEEDGITALIEEGFNTVPQYRRDPGLANRPREVGSDVWDLTYEGMWQQMKTPKETLKAWEADRDTIDIHHAEYTVFERYGHDWCQVRISASATDAEDQGGTRDGSGLIRITGVIPSDVDTEQYVEQYLDGDA